MVYSVLVRALVTFNAAASKLCSKIKFITLIRHNASY